MLLKVRFQQGSNPALLDILNLRSSIWREGCSGVWAREFYPRGLPTSSVEDQIKKHEQDDEERARLGRLLTGTAIIAQEAALDYRTLRCP
jgi:hypothetical protein